MEKIEAKDLLVGDVVVITSSYTEELKDVEGTIVQILCVDLPFIVGVDLAAHPEADKLIWRQEEASLALPSFPYVEMMLHNRRNKSMLVPYEYLSPMGKRSLRVRVTKANDENKNCSKIATDAVMDENVLLKKIKEKGAFHERFVEAERNLVKDAYEKMMDNIERSFYFSWVALDENKK